MDLQGRKGDEHVYVEIETGESDAAANMAKVAGLDGTDVFLFVTPDLHQRWADQLPPGALAVGPGDIGAIERALR